MSKFGKEQLALNYKFFFQYMEMHSEICDNETCICNASTFQDTKARVEQIRKVGRIHES